MGELTLQSFLSNYVLICAATAWLVAQVLKFLITLVLTGKPILERLTGSGGMPSSHTAMVCAAAIATARSQGLDSAVFAIALVLACIVMYDATGVRRQAGEHAKQLNKLNRDNDNDNFEDELLKEKLGHTPLEVMGGMLLGVIIAIIYSYFYR